MVSVYERVQWMWQELSKVFGAEISCGLRLCQMRSVSRHGQL